MNEKENASTEAFLDQRHGLRGRSSKKKEASTATTSVRQKPLSVLLDEIEERAKSTLDAEIVSEAPYSDTMLALNDVPKLVKALREAEDAFEAIAESPLHEAWWMQDAAKEALQNINALLYGEDAEEEKQNLGEP